METLEIEEKGLAPVKTGVLISKKILYIAGVSFTVILVGSILGTYFGAINSVDKDTSSSQLPSSSPLPSSSSPIQTTVTTTSTTQTSSSTQISSTFSTAPPLNYRLTQDLNPFYYDIFIQPYFKVTEEPHNYSANVTIEFLCDVQTNKLILHMKDLILDNSTLIVKSLNDTSFSEYKIDSKWTYNSINHFFTAEIPQQFKVNHSYIFTASFMGFTTDDLLGFYKSSYKDNANQTKWLITSQMEYIEARKSFICFDEPIFKSKFKIRIQHDKSLHAMSNMPVAKTTDIGLSDGYDWTVTEFEETVFMPTYLVAILVSDFKCKAGTSVSSFSKVDVSVCARPNAENKLELALNSSVDILSFFEEYYKVKYPLKKLDHAGVPDFKYGAMENWGLAIYREVYFIFDEKSTQTTEINVVRIIAHEISHMWFGNLVTPKWWDDLWLNEGFARFAEHVGSDAVQPEWRMYDRLFDLLLSVIQSDSTEETRPVSVDVNTPQEIDENINPTITYGKGSAIVKMLSYVLGDDTFRNGLKNYFEEFEYKNVDQFDLWKAMSEQMKSENKPISVDLVEAMTSWTKQKGHPVVTLKRINETHVSVSQNRFLLDANVPHLNDTLWKIPISLSIEELGSSGASLTNKINSTNSFDKFIWIDSTAGETIVPLNKSLNENNFLIVNLDMAVFCRINYDEHDWKLIADQLLTNTQELSARTRAQLISDVFSLSQALYIKPELALNHIRYLENELDYLPWNVFIDRVKYFTEQLDTTEVYSSWKKYLQKLVKPYYNKLGWIDNPQTDEWTDRLVRNKLVEFACQTELSDCLAQARSVYNDYIVSGIDLNLPSYLRRVAFCSSIEQGTDADFEKLFEKMKMEAGTLKSDMSYGLSCSKSPSNLRRYLNDQINSTLTSLRNVASKPNGVYVAWNFLKQNWNEIYEKYGSDFTYTVSDLAKKLYTQIDLNDIESFFNDKDLADKEKDELDVAIRQLKSNIKWFNQEFDSIKNWLLNLNIDTEVNYRLPTNLVPNSYDIKLKPYIGDSWNEKAFTFDGSISINFTCAEPTNKIIFHAIDLNLNTNTFAIESKDDIQIEKKYTEEKITNFIQINMNKECQRGSDYVLKMDFTGSIIENLYGFYRSSYQNEHGQTEYLATTHFQPTDARRAFPCFDEPALKASFKLTMIRHKNFSSSIFNTPLAKPSQSIDGEWFEDEFEETPKMSTYLVAFVVSNFLNISTQTSKGTEVDVWGRPERMNNGDGEFALKEAQLILQFFENYFNLPYPLAKSSQIGVPDFNAGAMENWGAIIYRETALFFNEKVDALANKQRVSSVVSHELAHQWFGNLVTPDWWNDIWLNEGFASWVEYLGVNYTHPEWNFLDLFYVQKLKVMELDSLESSHSVSFDVNDPGEINSLFDRISYDKGSSIIRMMNAFLTEKTFRNGVSNYLKNFAYKNAIQDDLWKYLTEQSHIDQVLNTSLTVKEIMDTWTLKKGYPYVTVNRNYDAKNMVLTQKWFLLNPSSKIKDTEEYNNYKWFVPFTFTSQINPTFEFENAPTWLKPSDNELIVDINNVDDKSWIIGNLKHSAFLRVNYDQHNWNLLIQQLKNDHSVIDGINRATLLDDSFNLGRAEIIDQLIFLNITEYLTNEEESLPFVPAFIGLDYIGNLIGNDYFTYDRYKKYVINLMNNTYYRLGWGDVSDDLIDLQISTLQFMCSFGFEDCIMEARSRFDDWNDNNVPLPSNFKNIIYSTVIKFGNEETWFNLYQKAIAISDNTEKLRIFRGLASTRDAALLSIILKSSSDKNIIRSQDETSVISYVAGNSLGRKLAFDHLEDNWDELFERHGDVSFTLSSLIDSVTKYLNTSPYLTRLLNFVEKNSNLGVTQKAFEQAIENVQFNVRWTNKNLQTINHWLTEWLSLNQ